MQKEKLTSKNFSSPLHNEVYYNCEDDEIDLYQLWLVLKRRFKFIIGTVIAFLGLALAYIFISPPIYKTETTIFPLGGKKEGISSMLANLPISLPIPTTSSITVETVLKSRILRERIIKKLNLLPVIFSDLWDENKHSWKSDIDKIPTILDGAKELEKLISVSSDKRSGVITLSVEFPKNPQLAYKIAATALNETQKILDEKNWSLAKQHRIFLENQIKEALGKWKLLEQVYSQFLQGKIKEVPLIVDEAFINQLLEKHNATQFNKKNHIDVESWKRKMKEFQSKLSVPSNISQYQFNYQKLQWQMNLLQDILTTLFQQYEIAKANEIKEQIAFQVIDPPYIPEKDKPYKPRKILIIAVATVSGLFLGIFLAFFMEWLENIRTRYNQVEEKNA
jgi:uncharacterized protein involved in exopolysaccharide biosynthesis